MSKPLLSVFSSISVFFDSVRLGNKILKLSCIFDAGWAIHATGSDAYCCLRAALWSWVQGFTFTLRHEIQGLLSEKSLPPTGRLKRRVKHSGRKAEQAAQAVKSGPCHNDFNAWPWTRPLCKPPWPAHKTTVWPRLCAKLEGWGRCLRPSPLCGRLPQRKA